MRKTLVKTPFEFNQVNSYLWNRQGKRHFWGVQGKDYGLIESPQNKNRKHNDHTLPEIKHQHITYNPHLPHPPLKSEKYEVNEVPQYRAAQRQKREINFRQYQSQKPIDRVHFKTQPIQQLIPRQSTPADRKKDKKTHLSLLTKNINLNLHEPDSLQIEKERMKQGDFFMNKGQINNRSLVFQQKRHNEERGRQRLKSEMNSYNLNEYRGRVVKVVRKDRRNNPTFCNSLAYPLPCYRYLQ